MSTSSSEPAGDRPRRAEPGRGKAARRRRRHVLLTGGTGFIGRRVCAELLRTGAHVDLLVRRGSLSRARRLIDELGHVAAASGGGLRPVVGDITRRGVVEDPEELRRLQGSVREIVHAAALYDLGVSAQLAEHFNVHGTQHVIELARECPHLQCLHLVSTIAVSGDASGVWREDMLTEGQRFDDQYALTKYRSEVLVREAAADGLPVSVFRPGVVVGDSRSGEVDKIDGPYYILVPLLRLKRLLPVSGLPVFPVAPARPGAHMHAVPVDFVARALAHISGLPECRGRTFCLTDPEPLTMHEFAELVTERLDLWGPFIDVDPSPVVHLARLPVVGELVSGSMRHLSGIPTQVLHYAAYAVSYDTRNASELLADTDIACPRLPEYFDVLVDYTRRHLL